MGNQRLAVIVLFVVVMAFSFVCIAIDGFRNGLEERKKGKELDKTTPADTGTIPILQDAFEGRR